MQVGPGDKYIVTIDLFNSAISTLGDSFGGLETHLNINGMKFSTKYETWAIWTDITSSSRDREQDEDGDRDCAGLFGGGWWYNACFMVRLTGELTDERQNAELIGFKPIYYYYGGDRGNSHDSWKEAEMLLVPVWFKKSITEKQQKYNQVSYLSLYISISKNNKPQLLMSSFCEHVVESKQYIWFGLRIYFTLASWLVWKGAKSKLSTVSMSYVKKQN